MREIKFRYRLKLISDDWGMYKKGDVATFFFNLNEESNGLHRFSIDERWEVVSIDEYTGLKDKNGVEIYEGDIVKFHTGVKYVDDQKMNVYFNKGSFGIRNVKHNGINMFCPFLSFENAEKSLSDKMDYTFLEQVIEVIGNIHENPELIN